MAKYDVDLRDYWRIIRRRKTIIIMTVVLISSCSFLFAKFNAPPPLYEATAAIKFERSTSVTGLYIQAISYSSGDPLTTQATIITGGPVMEKVAKDMGLIDPGLSSEQIRRSKELSQIIANLQNGVTAERITGTNIINITATASDAKTAERLANTVATVYREHNIAEKNKRIKEARSFIEDQLKSIGGRLKAAEERLKDYKEGKRLVMLEQGMTSAIAAVTELESQYQKVDRRIEEVASQLFSLKKGVEAIKTQSVFLEQVSPTVSKLNSALLDLIVRRDTLLLNYTQKSPQIQEVESQIRDIKENLERALSSTLKTLEKRKESLVGQIRTMYKIIPQEHLQLIRLQREVKVNEDLFSLLKSKYQEALIKEAEQVEEVVIVRSAMEPTKPIRSPKIVAITLVGLVIGSILGLVVAIVFESLDTSIGTIQDVEEFLNLPVLGMIPYSNTPEIKEALAGKLPKVKDEGTLGRYAYLLSHFAHNTPMAGSYQSLRTNVQIGFVENGVKTLLITSSLPIEGKTRTIINLALGMGQMGKRVLLVEADITKPKICKNFGIRSNQLGLVDVLLGNYKWTEVTKTISDIMLGQMTMKEIMLTPGIDNVNIMPSGLRHPSASQIIGSPRMKDFINEAKRKYDVVLLDSPPVLTSSDSAIMGNYVDGVIMVYKVGEVARGVIRRAKAQLEALKANVIGVVLNGVKPEISTDYDMVNYRYYPYSANASNLNGSLGRMLPSPKGLWQKLARAEEKHGPPKKRTWSHKKHRVVTCTLIILLLTVLLGSIVWPRLRVEEIQPSSRVTRKKILLPQQVPKTLRKAVAKVSVVKEINRSQHRVEETQPLPIATRKQILVPQEAPETPGKAVAKIPVVEKEIDRALLPAEEKVRERPYVPKQVDNISLSRWIVEVASSLRYKKAKSIAISLKEQGFPAYISRPSVNGQRWYRVRVGAYSSKAAAQNMKGRIIKEFGKTDCWVHLVHQSPHRIFE